MVKMSILERFKKWPVFSMKDVEKVASSKNYAKLIVHNNLSKGKIFKLGKGVYSFINDPVLSVYAFKPAYLGLEFALSFYEMWEQESIPVVITSRKVRFGVRKVLDENVLVRHMKPEGMFGYRSVSYFDVRVPVSTPEKTLADYIYYQEPIPKNGFRNLLLNCDAEKVSRYLTKMGLRKKSREFKRDPFSVVNVI